MTDDAHRSGVPAPFQVSTFSSLPSTSDEAKNRARQGAPHGTVIWALEQTSGRGRFQRAWTSPPGNLYMSVILRPDVRLSRVTELGFLAAVAVAECIASFLPVTVPVRVKWPNDVLVRGAKIAGILLETESSSDGTADWLVIGIGLNVASHPEGAGYPTAAIHGLTPLRPSVEAVLSALCTRLGAALDQWRVEGFDPIRQLWMGRAQGIGQPIELRQGRDILFGRFRDLACDGALLLETPTGVRRISAGEVHFPVA